MKVAPTLKPEKARTTVEGSRRRSREKTQAELQFAMLRIKNRGLRMSIAAVAAEAGVTPSLIHNTYPDIAEKIRAQVGRSTRQQRDEKAAELVKSRETQRDLRARLERANSDIAKLASINETLTEEIASLREQVAGKVIVLASRKDS
ncbi:TPA: TetR family transcriptional regulator [Burkholderia vietnamiensis]|nr:TetR family transcriptional regulator [Burkholderia vietnamiensis]